MRTLPSAVQSSATLKAQAAAEAAAGELILELEAETEVAAKKIEGKRSKAMRKKARKLRSKRTKHGDSVDEGTCGLHGLSVDLSPSSTHDCVGTDSVSTGLTSRVNSSLHRTVRYEALGMSDAGSTGSPEISLLLSPPVFQRSNLTPRSRMMPPERSTSPIPSAPGSPRLRPSIASPIKCPSSPFPAQPITLSPSRSPVRTPRNSDSTSHRSPQRWSNTAANTAAMMEQKKRQAHQQTLQDTEEGADAEVTLSRLLRRCVHLDVHARRAARRPIDHQPSHRSFLPRGW